MKTYACIYVFIVKRSKTVYKRKQEKRKHWTFQNLSNSQPEIRCKSTKSFNFSQYFNHNIHMQASTEERPDCRCQRALSIYWGTCRIAVIYLICVLSKAVKSLSTQSCSPWSKRLSTLALNNLAEAGTKWLFLQLANQFRTVFFRPQQL